MSEHCTMKPPLRLAAIGLCAFVGAVRADCPALSEFEANNLSGWLASTTGGAGSTGTEQHNGSVAAFAKHTGSLSHSLSCDAAYAPNGQLSFDMHAVAVASGTNLGGTLHSGSGVKISFLNAFNVTLGSIGIYNVTNSSWLGPQDFAVDAQQHRYDGTMVSFATAAGLPSNAAIAKISIAFTVSGESYPPTGTNSTATVWFDNVRVNPIPEPSATALMLAGLVGTAWAVTRGPRRRR